MKCQGPNNQINNLKIISPNPFSLAPIWDDSFFYCNAHLLEGTFSKLTGNISTRDYAIFSYPWNCLLSVNHINLFNEKDIHANQIISRFSEGSFIELFLFGLTKDSGKTVKKHISSEEFLSLFHDKRFLNYCLDENIDYFAFKLIQDKSDSDSPFSSNLTTFAKTSQLRDDSARTTFVIFVDSLDRSVIQSPELIQDLPNLKKLADQSMLFANYTSSGFWTFPCLHSIHHGVEPYLTGSFMRILRKLFDKYRQTNILTNSRLLSVRLTKINHLALLVLRANKCKSVAIKQRLKLPHFEIIRWCRSKLTLIVN